MAGYTTLDHSICGVKSEVTYGTDAFTGGAPTSGDVIAFRNLVITPVYEVIESDRLTATATGECHGIFTSHNDVTWEAPLIGSSSAGTLPPIDALLKAGNFKATVDAGVSVTYTPETANSMTDCPAATYVMYQRSIEDNTAKRIMARGCRTPITFNLEVGSEAFLGGTAQGLYDPIPTTLSALPSLPTSYTGDQCGWVVSRMVVEVGSTVYPVEAFEFSTNWATEIIRTGDPDTAKSGAAGQILLTKPKSGSRMGGSFTLVDGKTALTDMISKAYGGNKVALSVEITKGSRKIEFNFLAIQLGVFSDESPRYSVPFFAVRADGNAGNSDVSIIFS